MAEQNEALIELNKQHMDVLVVTNTPVISPTAVLNDSLHPNV